MGDRAIVRIAENFRHTLDAVRDFLEEAGAPEVFERLLDDLFATVIANLAEFPDAGIDFLERRALSQEGAVRARRLKGRLAGGDTLREYIIGDYLILYLSRADEVILLAIKHHRELSFDLRGHWARV